MRRASVGADHGRMNRGLPHGDLNCNSTTKYIIAAAVSWGRLVLMNSTIAAVQCSLYYSIQGRYSVLLCDADVSIFRAILPTSGDFEACFHGVPLAEYGGPDNSGHRAIKISQYLLPAE